MNDENIRIAETRDLKYSNLAVVQVSPSREHSKFRELYGSVNTPYLQGSKSLENPNYDSGDNGPRVA